MLRLIITSFIASVCISSTTAHAAILIEENNESVKNDYIADENNQSLASDSQQGYQNNTLIYKNSQQMRKNNKMGVGTEFGSTLGGLGFQFQLNFDPDNSLLLGIGNGSGFKSFHFGYKYSFSGQWFHPYSSVLLTHWYSSDKSKVSSSLVDSLYSESKKDYLSATFVAPTVGLQFNQLKGDLTGLSIYSEVSLLLDAGSFKSALTGGAGVIYFF